MRLFNTHTKAFKLTPATTPGKEYRKQLNNRSNMSNLSVVGLVHEVGETQQVTDTFKKRELILKIVDENPQFEEYVKFEATNDRTSIFDKVRVGDSVSVDFNLRGRPWTNKDGVTSYFNSLVAWRVSPLNQQEGAYAEMDATEADIF